MKFSEWYTQTKQTEVAQHSSDLIAEWFHRFNNFELAYEEETFWELFYCELLNSKLEIAKIGALVAQLKAGDKPEFNEFSLGNTLSTANDSTQASDVTNQGDDIQNYQGYNVEGTFSKNSSTTTNSGKVTSKNNSQTTSINQADELVKDLNLDLAVLFNNLYKRFLPLFLTLY